MAAAGVNPADTILRRGDLRRFARLTFPFIPGSDIAGVVEAIGSAVTRFRLGDAVFAVRPSISGGAYADYVTVSERDAAAAPPNLPLGDAAVIPLAGLTALPALRDKAGLRPGMRILINGASGGVGTFAAQIAKALGAHVSAATSEANGELACELGAEEVIDYKRDDVTRRARPYDVVFNAANAYPQSISFRQWQEALRPNGMLVTVSPAPSVLLLSRWTRLRGGKQLRSVFVQPSGADLEQLAPWVAEGRVRPVVERTYPLEEAVAAHLRSESWRTRGKLALIVDERFASLIPQSLSGVARTE